MTIDELHEIRYLLMNVSQTESVRELMLNDDVDRATKIIEREIGKMRNYHVVFLDGTERDVKAEWYEVDDGALNFFNRTANNNIETILTLADGTWRYVEVERLDDKS